MQLTRANTRPVTVQRSEDGTPQTISGYGAVFYRVDDPGTEFEIAPGVYERIGRTAFEGIGQLDVRSMFNHDPNQLLGRTTAGTLGLTVDNVGLRYEVTLPDTQAGRDVAASIDRGDVDGSSFWFKVPVDGYEKRTEDDKTVWELVRTEVIEVGPVVLPAYTATTSEARSKEREAVLAEVRKGRLQRDRDEADATVAVLGLGGR